MDTSDQPDAEPPDPSPLHLRPITVSRKGFCQHYRTLHCPRNCPKHAPPWIFAGRQPSSELVAVLLCDRNTLTPGEREPIATCVSYLKDGYSCQTIHGAIAAANLDDDEELVKGVKADLPDGLEPPTAI
jgi:hypothetical protein